MRRRDLLVILGGAAIAGPVALQAQQPPTVGYLSTGSPDVFGAYRVAFLDGLKTTGYIEGQNVAIEYRWGEGQYDRLTSLAADLVNRRVSVIAATGGPIAIKAAKEATSTIPIVFVTGGDPVAQGLVASLNRPGGNATGANFFIASMEAKRFGILHELMPKTDSIAVLFNPNNLTFETQLKDVESAAQSVGQKIEIMKASSEADIHTVFSKLAGSQIKGLLVVADPFFNNRREQLVTLAAHHRIVAVWELRDFAKVGGLISYGTSIAEAYRQVGIYAGRILKGEKPSDLPVVQSTKFELVINLKTAAALGLVLPPTLLARADEVIE